jgi:hypothetical protein
MAQLCSCGAELPDNARFCHRCGKPQREEDAGAQPPPIVVQPEAALRPAINFGNPAALRIALLCASISALLNSIPIVSFGCCLWFLGAGFFSVFLYSRRSGLMLSVGEGARMGWMTGLFNFVLGVVFIALTLVLTRGGGLHEAFRKSMSRVPATDDATRQVMEFLTENPVGLSIMVLTYLFLALLVTLSLTIAGGALGAKAMEKD